MRGRAFQLIDEFRGRHPGVEGSFAMSRLILLSRIVPEKIRPELDDPAIEQRIEHAIAKIDGATSATAQT